MISVKTQGFHHRPFQRNPCAVHLDGKKRYPKQTQVLVPLGLPTLLNTFDKIITKYRSINTILHKFWDKVWADVYIQCFASLPILTEKSLFAFVYKVCPDGITVVLPNFLEILQKRFQFVIWWGNIQVSWHNGWEWIIVTTNFKIIVIREDSVVHHEFQWLAQLSIHRRWHTLWFFSSVLHRYWTGGVSNETSPSCAWWRCHFCAANVAFCRVSVLSTGMISFWNRTCRCLVSSSIAYNPAFVRRLASLLWFVFVCMVCT